MEKKLYKIEKQEHCIQIEFLKGEVISPDTIIEAMDVENALYEIDGRHDLWDFRGCQPSQDFGYDDPQDQILCHIVQLNNLIIFNS